MNDLILYNVLFYTVQQVDAITVVSKCLKQAGNKICTMSIFLFKGTKNHIKEGIKHTNYLIIVPFTSRLAKPKLCDSLTNPSYLSGKISGYECFLSTTLSNHCSNDLVLDYLMNDSLYHNADSEQ